MTHAAVECAAIVRDELRDRQGLILVICGGGNNGGDGYAITRTLHSHGLPALALEVAESRDRTDARIMRESAHRMGLVHPWSQRESLLGAGNLIAIVDAIFGTGLDRRPSGVPLDAIRWINAHLRAGAAVYSIDIPSGLDCDSGEPLGGPDDAVIATRTLTMVREKLGFASNSARKYLGTVSEVSIGGPRIAPSTQASRTVAQ